MALSQLNVRLDEEIKRGGEATLARFGVSTTQAIRALWNYLAEANTLPSFMVSDEMEPADVTVASSAATDGAGMAVHLAREQGLAAALDPLGYDELRELAFEELVAEGVYRV